MLVTLVALLAAVGVAPASHGPRTKPATCAVVAIEAEQPPRRRPPSARHDPSRRHSFRATRILALEFETQLSGHLRRGSSLQLRLYTPGGFLYQVLEVPVERGGRSRRRLEARLPVAGTSIMASGLYGRWTIVPHLDNRREPCGRGRSFVIQP